VRRSRSRFRRRARPRQERATASVDAILEAARRVLQTHGFAKTTTNRIAEVAGVNVALVYRYFAGKEAIVGELVDTPSLPALHRELVEHVDVTKRRELIHQLGAETARLFGELLAGRARELRRLPDRAATLFLLEHVIEAASHAVAFYGPASISRKRAVDALTDLLVRTLVPTRDPR
jgi:AcrR family transcriptional regulator